jgi:hypothetical protein
MNRSKWTTDHPLTQEPALQRRFIGGLHVIGQLVDAQISGGVGSHPCGLGSDSGTTQGAWSIVACEATLGQPQQAPSWLS